MDARSDHQPRLLQPHWITLPEALAADDLEVTLIAPAFVPSIALWEHRAPASTGRVEVIGARTISRNGHFIFMPSWRVYRRLKPDVVHTRPLLADPGLTKPAEPDKHTLWDDALLDDIGGIAALERSQWPRSLSAVCPVALAVGVV